MPGDILLSVAMPTHNRSQYAISAIQSVLSIASKDMQLVVSDTSTDGKLKDLLVGAHADLLNDSRLIYAYVDEPSDITDNYNRAVSLCEGEYICLIGDDDTVTSYLIKAAKWAARNSKLCISQTISANYAWPDFRSKVFGSGHASRVYLPKVAGDSRCMDSANSLAKGLSNAFQGADGMALCYHGLVHRSIYEKAKRQSGSYFHGSSPDISGSIAATLFSHEILVTDFPLTIPGAGGGSNTGRAAMNEHKGAFDSELQTKIFAEKGWLEEVPRFFSVETTWAHAGLVTLAALEPSYLNKFNFMYLYAICYVNHPDYRKEIDSALQSYCKNFDVEIHVGRRRVRSMIMRYRLKRLRYVCNRLLRPTASGGRIFKSAVEDVRAAGMVVEEYIESNRGRMIFPFV